MFHFNFSFSIVKTSNFASNFDISKENTGGVKMICPVCNCRWAPFPEKYFQISDRGIHARRFWEDRKFHGVKYHAFTCKISREKRMSVFNDDRLFPCDSCTPKNTFNVFYCKTPTFQDDDFPTTISQFFKDFIFRISVKASSLDDVYWQLQDVPLPSHLREKGLHHSSMSVGDIIENPEGKFFMVITMGFKELNMTRGDIELWLFER